jgi:lipopolysaccharide export system protein LptC
MSGSSASGQRPTMLPPDRSGRRMLAPSRARQMMSAGALARRRFLVRAAKWLLPAAALALLATVALWPEFDSAEDRGRVAFRRATQAQPDSARVVEPRYQGVDEQNRPYTVTAASAAQQGSSNLVDMDQPKADVTLGDDGWVMLEARHGLHDRDRNWLDLDGDVTLWHANGTTMTTDRAAIDIKAGAASGDAPVAAQGPFGTLTSDGFRLIDRGRVVIFTGKARAVLEGGE